MAKNLRTYETICLTKVDMPESQFKNLLEKCQKAVESNGKGEWGLVDDWGKAKISFPINKEERAQWTYFRYKSQPEGVNELTRALKINEFVLRQLTNKTKEDSSDYEGLRETMAKELSDRDKVREWKDNRKRGPRSSGGGYQGRRPYHSERSEDQSQGEAPSSFARKESSEGSPSDNKE